MGKSLVIRGADFSANGIEVISKTWYITLGTDHLVAISPNPTNNSGSASWAFDDTTNALIQGKTVNLVKLIPNSAGNFYLYKTSSLSASLGSPVATIQVKSSDIGNLTEYEVNDIEIGANEYLVFANPSQTVKMYYAYSSASHPLPGHYFYKRVGFNDYTIVQSYQLLIDVGYKGVVTP